MSSANAGYEIAHRQHGYPGPIFAGNGTIGNPRATMLVSIVAAAVPVKHPLPPHTVRPPKSLPRPPVTRAPSQTLLTIVNPFAQS